jgi:hypothetical protein
MDSRHPEAASAEVIDYMSLRAAATANMQSNKDSSKLPSEEKGIRLKDNTTPLSTVLLRADAQLGVLKKIGRLSPPIHSSRNGLLPTCRLCASFPEARAGCASRDPAAFIVSSSL